MIPYLILISLLVPANLWASITPHLHSDLSMRLLHGVSTAQNIPCTTPGSQALERTTVKAVRCCRGRTKKRGNYPAGR